MHKARLSVFVGRGQKSSYSYDLGSLGALGKLVPLREVPLPVPADEESLLIGCSRKTTKKLLPFISVP